MLTKKSHDDQVAILNTLVKIRIAPSKIHGVGIVAITDIPAGTKLYADSVSEIYNLPYDRFKELYPHVRALLLERWPLITQGSLFVYPDARMIAYMNHSDNPNFDNQTDRAIRDIKAGEEITEDYRNIKGHEQLFPFLTKKKVL